MVLQSIQVKDIPILNARKKTLQKIKYFRTEVFQIQNLISISIFKISEIKKLIRFCYLGKPCSTYLYLHWSMYPQINVVFLESEIPLGGNDDEKKHNILALFPSIMYFYTYNCYISFHRYVCWKARKKYSWLILSYVMYNI